jgi:hypothetical protein
MRQSISVVLAALAALAVSAVPAMACGYSACGQTYAPPVAYAPTGYSGCTTGCNTGWAFAHLSEPDTQYYYVNQGPTYTGPGAFAPAPTYQESALSGSEGYRVKPYYYGYRWHHRHPYHWGGYGYAPYHPSPRYGYMPYYYGHRVLRRYY